MTRSVTGRLKEDPKVIVERLYRLADKHDVHFTGDSEKGFAKGKGFHVEYLVEGESCTLTVTKKPLLIPWALVESQLEKLFND
ncbi:MAG: hypothetical protein CMK83_16770 [Pseudomonadales bacterium]|jgi:hypothetical protein|uniref:hypothetical protein n=1 Tax=unclassified Ketobacter TaxID=2639109 RepID=UPI000C6ADA47|nr:MULTISPECIES: hypothetical protein [unclassified Ketobacter]MAQ25859.1 hypothetical protein [Pseudomonadales bacterium]MEC8810920.1 hypothetical protein [Pseudomonadota bacterium]TNC83758.1 MAG: hypothetical protein CSH49_20500 [Alcanivorax sp.]HAG96906.1 hypothetical protein [Gammaproteobacteria bacterium]MBI28038.1 hypothetical protein [Pseudomonadales bacterium]|tara:strand:- start:1638 stop:1886 length:249 start_codon:yes stop_codon:yes gene_type:complete